MSRARGEKSRNGFSTKLQDHKNGKRQGWPNREKNGGNRVLCVFFSH